MLLNKNKFSDIFIGFFIIFMLFAWNSTAQYPAQRDSFRVLFNQAIHDNNDSLKLKYLHMLAQTYMHSNVDSLKILSDSLLQMARSLKSDKYIGIAYELIGNYHSINFRNDTARYFFKEAIGFAEKAGDSMTKAFALGDIGTSFLDYNPDSAIYYYQKAIALNKVINNQYGLFFSYYNLGVMFDNHEKPQKALHYYLLASKYADSIHNISYHGYVNIQLGSLFKYYLEDPAKAKKYYQLALKDFEQTKDMRGQSLVYGALAGLESEKAVSYSLKALALAKEIGDMGNVVVFSHNTGMRYMDKNKLDSAEYYFRQSLELAKKYNFNDLLVQSYRELGKVYTLKKEWTKAQDYLMKSWQLAKKDTVLEYKIQTLYYLSDLAKAKQDFEKAYHYFVQADSLESYKDSIQNLKAIREVEAKYQAEKKERENLQLKKEKAEQALALQRQTQRTRTLMAASGGTLLLSGMFMFFWVRLRRKNKTIRQLQRVLAHRTKGYLQKIVDFIDYIVEYIKETEATPEEIAVKVEELKSRIMTIIRAQELIMRKGGILSLDEYVGALVGEWRAMLKDRLISIRTEVEEGLNLSGSQVLPVGLILDEFVLNSSKYAFDEGHRSPEIRINARAEGGKLILEMRDNGRGGSVEEVKGSGFGLNMMRRIVEQQLKGKLLIDGTAGFYMRVEMPLEQKRKHEPVKESGLRETV